MAQPPHGRACSLKRFPIFLPVSPDKSGDLTGDEPMGRRSRNTCTSCRRAKIRCDRGSPCGRCVRMGLPCIEQMRAQGRPIRLTTPDHVAEEDGGGRLGVADDTNALSAGMKRKRGPTEGAEEMSVESSKTPRSSHHGFIIYTVVDVMVSRFIHMMERGAVDVERVKNELRCMGHRSMKLRKDSSYGALGRICKVLELDAGEVAESMPVGGLSALSDAILEEYSEEAGAFLPPPPVLATGGDRAGEVMVMEVLEQSGRVLLRADECFTRVLMSSKEALRLLAEKQCLPIFLWGGLLTPESQYELYDSTAETWMSRPTMDVAEAKCLLTCIARDGTHFSAHVYFQRCLHPNAETAATRLTIAALEPLPPIAPSPPSPVRTTCAPPTSRASKPQAVKAGAQLNVQIRVKEEQEDNEEEEGDVKEEEEAVERDSDVSVHSVQTPSSPSCGSFTSSSSTSTPERRHRVVGMTSSLQLSRPVEPARLPSTLGVGIQHLDYSLGSSLRSPHGPFVMLQRYHLQQCEPLPRMPPSAPAHSSAEPSSIAGAELARACSHVACGHGPSHACATSSSTMDTTRPCEAAALREPIAASQPSASLYGPGPRLTSEGPMILYRQRAASFSRSPFASGGGGGGVEVKSEAPAPCGRTVSTEGLALLDLTEDAWEKLGILPCESMCTTSVLQKVANDMDCQ